MVSDKEILREAQKIVNEAKGRKVFASTIKNYATGKYETNVMVSYSGGDGIGSMGAMSVLQINYNSEKGAKRMKDMINALKPEKQTKKKKKK